MSQKNLGKCAAFVIVLLLGAAVVFAYLWVQRWPKGELVVQRDNAALTLAEPATLRVTTNQAFDQVGRHDLGLVCDGIPGLTVNATRLVADGEHLVFELDVTPTRPVMDGQLRLTLESSKGKSISGEIPVDVSMPTFFHDRGVTFVEMMESPAFDIYGSDITLWKSDAGLTVAGHANSSVCRRVSSSVWRIGTIGDLNNPNFFIGAGFAFIPPNRSETKLDARVEAFAEAFPSLWSAFRATVREDFGLLRSFVPSEAVERQVRARLNDLLADLLTYTDSELVEPDPQWQQRLQRLVSMQASAEERAADVRTLAGNGRVSVEQFLAMQASGSPLRATAAEMDAEDLAAARRFAAELYDRVSAEDQATEDLALAAETTGLVMVTPPHESTLTASAGDAIRNRVAAFATRAADNVTSDARQAAFMADLSGGHRGVLLLPFYDAAGEPVRFRLPRSSVIKPSSPIWRLMENSIQADMAEASRRTVVRLRRLEREGHRELAMIASRPDLDDFVDQPNEYEFNIVDERGRPTGETDTDVMNGTDYFLNRMEYTAANRRAADAFASLADSLERANDDPTFQHMILQATADSFLRGWPLSFVDPSMEEYFKRWITEGRDRVWGDLFEQGAEQGIDPKGLISETTVFLIRTDADGGELAVEPRAVVDLAAFAVRYDPALGYTIYDSFWSSRQPEPMSADERVAISANGNNRIDLAAVATARAKEAMAALPVTNGEEQAPVESIADDFREAFTLHPPSAARVLIDGVLAYLPEESPVGGEHIQQAMMLINDDTAGFWELVDRGKWLFPDQYLMLAQVPDMDAEVKAFCIENAKQLDSEYTDIVLENPAAIESRSLTFSAALQAAQLDEFTQALRVARDLGEAVAELDGSSVDLYTVKRHLRSAYLQMGTDTFAESAAPIRTSLKEILDEIDAQSDADAIDHFSWKASAEGLINELVSPMIADLSRLQEAQPSRRLLETVVELTWVSGDAVAALNQLTMSTARFLEPGELPTYIRLVQLIAELRTPIVKGLVYTGQDHVVRDIFSRRLTDYVLVPSRLDEVFPRLRFHTAAGAIDDLPAQLVRRFDNATPNAPASVVGQSLDDGSRVLRESRGFTDTRAYVLETPRGREVIKVRPNRSAYRAEAEAGVAVSNHLERKGLPVAKPLPARRGRLVDDIDGRHIVTRETAAPGQPLDATDLPSTVRREVMNEYTDLNFAILTKGADIDSRLLARDAVVTTGQMRDQVTRRNELARVHTQLYRAAASQAALLDDATVARTVGRFHDKHAHFLDEVWPDSMQPIEALGLVHDAHAGNFFVDLSRPAGQRLTAIDFDSDYLGSIGHNFAIMARAELPRGQWSYREFSQLVDSYFARYEATTGRTLTDTGKRHAIQAMAFPPFKFASSDSRRAFNRLRRELGLDADAPAAELQAKLETDAGRQAIERVLGSSVDIQKYQNAMRLFQATYRKLKEFTSDPARIEEINSLLKDLDVIISKGIRVANCDLLDDQLRAI